MATDIDVAQNERGEWVDESTGEVVLAADLPIADVLRSLYAAREEKRLWERDAARYQAIALKKIRAAGEPFGMVEGDRPMRYSTNTSSRQRFNAEAVVAWMEDARNLAFLDSEVADLLRAVSGWKTSELPASALGDAVRRAITYTGSEWLDVRPTGRVHARAGSATVEGP